MKLTSLRDVRALLDARGIRPSKALGQNFLHDANLIEWIVALAEVGPDDEVLEVGPGLGGLTEALAGRAGRVVAVETDRRLLAILAERTGDLPHLERIHGDALKTDFDALFGTRPWKVVSNLPYSVGTRVLVRFTESANPPARIVATLQRDVGERIVAKPGGAAYGVLAIWTQRLYDARLARSIPPTCFYPAPGVLSAVVDLRRRASPRCAPRDPALFRELTRRAFMRRRKQMRRILSDLPPELRPAGPPDPDEWLAAAGIAPEARPETLPVESWGALADALARNRGDRP